MKNEEFATALECREFPGDGRFACQTPSSFLFPLRLPRRIVLQLLMNLTARALGQKPRHLWTLPADEALRVYAEFTRFHLGTGIDHQILQRLNDEAYRMGWLLRRVFFLRRPDQTLLFLIALYQAIGINLEGQLPGRLCFRRCFFSRYYTPETCLAASALDQGIMRGLMGSGTLHFQQRITEGCNHCLATFV